MALRINLPGLPYPKREDTARDDALFAPKRKRFEMDVRLREICHGALQTNWPSRYTETAALVTALTEPSTSLSGERYSPASMSLIC
jgi:hypothetical protein